MHGITITWPAFGDNRDLQRGRGRYEFQKFAYRTQRAKRDASSTFNKPKYSTIGVLVALFSTTIISKYNWKMSN